MLNDRLVVDILDLELSEKLQINSELTQENVCRVATEELQQVEL